MTISEETEEELIGRDNEITMYSSTRVFSNTMFAIFLTPAISSVLVSIYAPLDEFPYPQNEPCLYQFDLKTFMQRYQHRYRRSAPVAHG